MTLMTARGADTAEAMEQILRRLGANAFILSTTLRNGYVEIQATDEPDGPTDADEPLSELAAPIQLHTPEGETMAQRAKRFSDLLEARSDWAPPPKLRPAVPPRRTPWSKTSPEAMQAALLDKLETDLLAADALPVGQLKPRTVIVGPPGSGKSYLAVRLAASAMLADRSLQPRLIAPRLSNPISDDRLRGWSRLLGLTAEAPLIGDFLQKEGAADFGGHNPQIIDLSGIPAASVELVASLAQSMPTEIVLALPTGLSARRTLRETEGWGIVSARVCLTFCDLGGADKAQLGALAEAGTRLSRAATGSGIVQTISVPDRAQLARWLQEEADEIDSVNKEGRA